MLIKVKTNQISTEYRHFPNLSSRRVFNPSLQLGTGQGKKLTIMHAGLLIMIGTKFGTFQAVGKRHTGNVSRVRNLNCA